MIFITREEELQIGLPQQSLYFYASWMPYHQKLLTMISIIQTKYQQMAFSAVDVDQFRNLCKRFQITVVPTILILKKGEKVQRIDGLIPTATMKSIYADIGVP